MSETDERQARREEEGTLNEFGGLDPADYRLVAERSLEYRLAAKSQADRTFLEIGKWLLASCLAINVAGVAATLQLSEQAEAGVAFVAFLVGVVAAMGCGLFTWVNARTTAEFYADHYDPNILLGYNYLPDTAKIQDEYGALILRTYWLGLSCGFIAVSAFIVGAIALWNG